MTFRNTRCRDWTHNYQETRYVLTKPSVNKVSWTIQWCNFTDLNLMYVLGWWKFCMLFFLRGSQIVFICILSLLNEFVSVLTCALILSFALSPWFVCYLELIPQVLITTLFNFIHDYYTVREYNGRKFVNITTTMSILVLYRKSYKKDNSSCN